ncbi:MAG: peptide chain release factor N(5)-glutamine methyltransferase [Prevotella sp.]|nr:peptide chain release factor N(5)-glutamine methyltransferase [Prevotella sp.]
MTYDEFWRPLTSVYERGEAQAVARLVLEMGYGLTLADMLSGNVEQLPEERLSTMQRRLLAGEPVQYVLGETEFCGRRLLVGPGVLIPRPETEELCHLILHDARRSTPRILDIGTGSGCIAVTLAAELPKAEVTAWDVSPEALRIARENAKRSGVHVSFEQVDILKPQSLELNPQSLDLIVSNPPYVCERERATMAPNVLEHEPELALFVPDDDSLRFYRAIGDYALQALKPGGLLFFELNSSHAQATATLLAEQGFQHITIHQDQFGKDRFIRACR